MRSIASLPAAATSLAFVIAGFPPASSQVPGGSLPPTHVPKYVTPLAKPPQMPRAGKLKAELKVMGGRNADYYEIAVRQFTQQILPPTQSDGVTPIPPTTVWSYGPSSEVDPDGTGRHVSEGGHFFYPAFTIENTYNKPTVVKWINGLVDGDGHPLPHIIPVDPTLHWANPIGHRDHRPPRDREDPYWDNPHLQFVDQGGLYPVPLYKGPVPIVTHVHGAHTTQESDGYGEAWYLPASAAVDPHVMHATGTFYDYFRGLAELPWEPGSATFTYPNNQRAGTLWYHDHTLGMTRANVYAGPAGFFLIRGGPDDLARDSRTGARARLPAPAPGKEVDPFGTFYEIPIAIQDRSFNADGSLFYPDNRAFFEGLQPDELLIPFSPGAANGGPSDIAPIWQPEFFGNMIVVNGATWPYLDVEQRRYRFRLLNGCNARFLILDFSGIAGVTVHQIGTEGGFLPAPVSLTQLLLAPAERADVIVDFTHVPAGNHVLANIAPDEPFGGGVPGEDFDPADPDSTGQVLQFRVGPARTPDTTTPAQFLQLPAIAPLTPTITRQVTLHERDSDTVTIREENGAIVFDPEGGEPFGPEAALLGTLADGALGWADAITENPALGSVETWEIWNFTMDAHPIHIHELLFQVVNREAEGIVRPPEPSELGWKDTVIVYPGEITRVRMHFDLPGLYVWHCHIVEHEDNEMMRPYYVGAIDPNAPLPQNDPAP
ncbi:MAG TPA: multicopper oxidase [Opitutaceae bacterium]